MNTAQLSHTLLASWRQRDRASSWGRWLIAALVVLTVAGSAYVLPSPQRGFVAMTVALVVLYSTWMVVAHSLLEQNQPTAALCVPGHVLALRLASVVGWAGCTALSTGLLWAILSPMVMWQSLLLGSAATAAFMMWTTRAWWLWLGLAIYLPLLGAFHSALAPVGAALYGHWLEHTGLLLVAGLLVSMATTAAAIGTGNARHRRAYERQRRLRDLQRLQTEGRMVSPVQAFSGLERLSRPFSVMLDAWRERLLARAESTPASAMARAELVLHGNQHWTYQLLTMVLILAAVALSLMVLTATTAATLDDLFTHGAFGMGIGVASMAINPTLARPMLWQSRREQALLRLLPGMPQGPALNRAVAWIALRHALVAAALTTAVLLPLGLANDKLMLLWLPLMAVPWSVATATRSPADMRAPTALTSVLPVFAFYTSAGIGYFTSAALAWPMSVTAPALLAATAIWGAWRWRRLDTQPVALPVGRWR